VALQNMGSGWKTVTSRLRAAVDEQDRSDGAPTDREGGSE